MAEVSQSTSVCRCERQRLAESPCPCCTGWPGPSLSPGGSLSVTRVTQPRFDPLERGCTCGTVVIAELSPRRCGAFLSCHSRKADIICFCVLPTGKVFITFFPSKCISLQRDIEGETELSSRYFNTGIRNSGPALSLCLFSLHVCKSVLMEVSPDFTYTSSALAALIIHLCVSVAVLHHKQFSYNEIF